MLFSKNDSKGLKKTETCTLLTFFEQNLKFQDTEKVIGIFNVVLNEVKHYVSYYVLTLSIAKK